MTTRSHPIRELPPAYREVLHLVLTAGKYLLALNLLAVGVMVAAGWLLLNWWMLVNRARGGLPGAEIPWWLGALIVFVIFPLHEVIHAAAIAVVGHKPRMGAKLNKGVLYATADGALFRRGEFIFIALAPLVAVTAAGMALMLVVPDSLSYWIGLAAAVNAGGAVGDVWMVAVVSRYAPSALVRDEEDGIRVYEASPISDENA